MKKILAVAAVMAMVFSAGSVMAGSQGRAQPVFPDYSTDIDGLKSSQARQDEEIKVLQTDVVDIKATAYRPAENPWYIKAYGKYTMLSSVGVYAGHGFETDGGYGASLGVGKKFGQFSLGLVADYQKNDFNEIINGDVSMATGMVDATYEIPVFDDFSLYLNGGAGFAKTEISVTDVEDGSDYSFAYKVGAGVTYAVNRQLNIDLGYEYLAATDVTVFDSDFSKIDSSNVVAGVRYSF